MKAKERIIVEVATNSDRVTETLKGKGAKVKKTAEGTLAVSFEPEGLKGVEEIKPKTTKVVRKRDDYPATTAEMKALLRKQGVKYTVILKRADMLEIIKHPEKRGETIDKVRKEWQAYVKARRGK